MSDPPDRPLRLGELLAVTTQIYGERLSASLGLGAVVGGALLLGFLTGHIALYVAVASLTFTAVLAAATRIVAGDGFAEAWAQVALRLPALAVFAVVAFVPFALGRVDPVILLFSVAWLAATGFSIPVVMAEREGTPSGWFARLGYALTRSLTLARAEYFHAAGVIAALVLIYVLLAAILARALVTVADAGGYATNVLVQVVLAPFFFLGLAVLYFEQRARLAARRR